MWSLSEQGLLTDTLDGMGTSVTLLALCGHILVSASQSAPYLKVWDLTYDRKHKTLAPVPDRTGCTAVSHDGNYVYFPQPGDSHKVIIWDSTEGELQSIKHCRELKFGVAWELKLLKK